MLLEDREVPEAKWRERLLSLDDIEVIDDKLTSKLKALRATRLEKECG
jgi:hypothetical protein